MVWRHGSPGPAVPHDVVGVVVAVQADRPAQAWGVFGVAFEADQLPSVRAGADVAAHRQGATFRVRGFTERVCAGPKEGAVTVANTTGCPPTEVGTPVPPTRPASMSW